MRMTVGPLPASVYWRRRVVVLAAVLITILLVVWECSGSGSPTPKSAPSPGHGGAARGGSGSPTDGSSTPGGETPGGGTPGGTTPSGGLSTAGPRAEGGADGDDEPPVPRPTGPAPTCGDDDMSVSARTASEHIPAGSYPTLFLTIGNSSTHACTRDIGADAQELWITHDGRRVWSSDYCNPNHDKDVRRFEAGVQVTFHLIWDGRSASRGCKDGGVLPRGRYELGGRVGGKTGPSARFELD